MNEFTSNRPDMTGKHSINCLWEHIVYAMFLKAEHQKTTLFLGENLKIELNRSFDGDQIRYDGLLMRNIGTLGAEDWRVATSLLSSAEFSALGEEDLFDRLIRMLEELGEMRISFYILSPKKTKVLVSMQFTALG